MSTIKSSDEHLTLNADGTSKDIKFQANGVEKASISSSGAFTSTTIDATKLTGDLPALNGSALTNLDAADVSGTHTNLTSTGIDDNATTTTITIAGDNKTYIGDHTSLGDAKVNVFANNTVSSSGDIVMQLIDNNSTVDSTNEILRCKFRGDGNATNGIFISFDDNDGKIGSITAAGTSSVAFNTSSDYRLKENVDYDWDATTRLKQLKPARFNFITDDTNTLVDGFIAHEVSSVVPEAVTGEKDAMIPEVLYAEGDDIPEGKSVGDVKTAAAIDPQGIDQSKLVPLLVKTIQELEARIAALEA